MEIYKDLKNWGYGQEEDLCRVRVYFKEKENKLDWQRPDSVGTYMES